MKFVDIFKKKFYVEMFVVTKNDQSKSNQKKMHPKSIGDRLKIPTIGNFL